MIKDDITFMEEEMFNYLKNDFEYLIKKRGEEYYNSDKIKSLVKSENEYYAKVMGSNGFCYNVKFIIEYNNVYYDCNCPYNGHCKHEYAVLLAINDKMYNEVTLLPTITENKETMIEIIKKIPADELKKYFLSKEGQENVWFNIDAFETNFRKFYPMQEYEYYYNNLYNTIILNNDYEFLVNDYFKIIESYFKGLEFFEAFKIIKSIIEAFYKANILDDDFLNNNFNKIGMYLRIIYRKSNLFTRDIMDKWVSELKEKNYYNNLYLEDIILSIK